jgi:uncharacterized protein (UPF0335 family)
MALGRNTLDGQALLAFVERVEAIDGELKELKDARKDILTEATRAGFTAKGISFATKVRAMKPRDFQDAEQTRDLYLHAIGMAEEPPLFRQIDALAGESLARQEIIERLKGLVPSKGEITIKLESGAPMRLWRDKDGNAHAAEIEPAKPMTEAPARATKPSGQPPAAEVPDVDEDGAEELGRQYARDNKPIITNPFMFGDKRRWRFDVGWRKQTGNDGMGPDE